MEPLIETWQINQRINLYLLQAIGPERLPTPLTKGKSVAASFAHIHNVRLMWLKPTAPDLHEGQIKLEGGESIESIAECLSGSGEGISEVLRRAGSPEGRVKNFKPHAAGFLAYMVAHESFHRAQIELALRQAGTPLDDKTAYGTWEWGVR